MAKRHISVTISIDGNLWVDYKIHCAKKDVHPSNEIEGFIKKELKKEEK